MERTLYSNVDDLGRAMRASGGIWVVDDDPMRRVLGWREVASGRLVGIELTRVKMAPEEQRRALSTPEGREEFARACSGD